MKSGIHPTYYPKAKISCACGNSMTLGATHESIKVEICSKCHPFYTGSHDLIDTTGRVERFKARKAKASPGAAKKVKKVNPVRNKPLQAAAAAPLAKRISNGVKTRKEK